MSTATLCNRNKNRMPVLLRDALTPVTFPLNVLSYTTCANRFTVVPMCKTLISQAKCDLRGVFAAWEVSVEFFVHLFFGSLEGFRFCHQFGPHKSPVRAGNGRLL